MIPLPKTDLEFTQFALQYSGKSDTDWALIEEYEYTDCDQEWKQIQQELHRWIDWTVANRADLVQYRIAVNSHLWLKTNNRCMRIWIADIAIDNLVFDEKFYYHYKNMPTKAKSKWGARHDDIVERCRRKD